MEYINVAKCFKSGVEVLTVTEGREVLADNAFPGLELGGTVSMPYVKDMAEDMGIPYPCVTRGFTIMRPIKNKNHLQVIEFKPDEQVFTAYEHLAIDRYVATYGEEPRNNRAFIKSCVQHGLRKAVMVKH